MTGACPHMHKSTTGLQGISQGHPILAKGLTGLMDNEQTLPTIPWITPHTTQNGVTHSPTIRDRSARRSPSEPRGERNMWGHDALVQQVVHDLMEPLGR